MASAKQLLSKVLADDTGGEERKTLKSVLLWIALLLLILLPPLIAIGLFASM